MAEHGGYPLPEELARHSNGARFASEELRGVCRSAGEGLGREEPEHVRGEVTGQPGLYLVGLHYLYAMSSAMIHGVGRDADHVAGRIARRAAARPVRTARGVRTG